MSPPEGYSKKQIEHMSDSDLLDMNYFLNEFNNDNDWDHEPEPIPKPKKKGAFFKIDELCPACQELIKSKTK